MPLAPRGLQKGHIDVLDSWLHRWRSSPNVTKTYAMTFNPPTGQPENGFTMEVFSCKQQRRLSTWACAFTKTARYSVQYNTCSAFTGE